MAMTPMIRQYFAIKAQHPGALLFFRLGDFYEMFFDDAQVASRELDLTLTARHKDTAQPVPMCGVPHHAAAGYIARLVERGYRVAICEQTEEAAGKTKLVERAVVRIVTPGTSIEDQLLQGAENRFLAALVGSGQGTAVALLDATTGEFWVTELRGDAHLEAALNLLERFDPREVLAAQSLAPLLAPAFPPPPAAPAESARRPPPRFPAALTLAEDWRFAPDAGETLLREHFGVLSLAGFGLEGKPYAIGAAAAVLRYLRETQMNGARHVTTLSWLETTTTLELDALTLKNLEVIAGADGSQRDSLLSVLDETVTSMGARLLRQWLLRPSRELTVINARLDAVAELHQDPIRRDGFRQLLRSIQDIERLVGRLSLNLATPRDVAALRESCAGLPALKERLLACAASLPLTLGESLDACEDLRQRIADTIVEAPPAKIEDGQVIRPGFNAELDELRHARHDASGAIAAIERRERERTGIGSLKIRFNNVFGYYIEVTKANLARVPRDYERKQTIANGERYTTAELKQLEARLRDAETRIVALETEIFEALRDFLVENARRLQAAARIVGMLDALAGLAEVAARRRYARPELHAEDELVIEDGRHPVVEARVAGFVPNDARLNNSTDRLLVITGPNMGGKSVFLRQVGLIALMAHVGSFVPARRARIPLMDRIFTRIGASDNVARGRSTFMVEMTETACILNATTPRSLVLLDEIGRGTATFDGLSLAWAVCEYLHDNARHAAKTLFATHYHELVDLARILPGVRNVQLAVSERDGDIVFLHRVIEGSANKSYGIEVGRLAGLPPAVVARAREILANLEANELDVLGKPKLARHLPARRGKRDQPTLFEAANESVIEELRELDISELTPDMALVALRRLQERLL
ncbi:MAG: DNA mismatch repair protein MutS [Chloracidobacterium sp. CP2_5A]|nr:MAG: DNA mismatch repair protein MutS [Chloracidobacterium sp. CP2_5A]